MYLFSRDSKGKIRQVILDYEYNQPVYVIHRTTGLFEGKLTQQPDIIIDKGKAGRTIKEQFTLKFNSLKKEYLDKGYKEVTGEITLDTINTAIGEVVTGQLGVPKPMLAKQADSIANRKVFDKEYYASRKIDGLRTLIYMDRGELHTSSRGSVNYDAAMCEILENPRLIQLFKDHPGLIMDGECYRHGLSLADINSYARTQKVAKDYTVLQFYWYDIVDLNKSFEERLEVMNSIKDELNLGFEPDREFVRGELRIQFVPQVSISGWDNMLKLHNDYVEEGWEGLVIRLKSATYGPFKRTNDMIKIKQYDTTTGKVIGIEQGLRLYHDMVFIMETLDTHIQFKAKPKGTLEIKTDYTNNFEECYKGHLADYKFFYLSKDGVPLQPCMTAFRFDLE